MKKGLKLVIAFTLLLAMQLSYDVAFAQMTLTGQVRTRTEVRNGFANLLPANQDAATFTSQRTRLNFGYKWDRVLFSVVPQDVRVWGQDASTISPADGGKLMLHEGWADITLMNKADTLVKTKLFDNMNLKVGRQELIYDDARLIGNLDWLQQGRRFDMALLKIMHKGYQFDLGAAYNQNGEFNDNRPYVSANVNPYVANSNGVLVPTPAGFIPNGTTGINSNAGNQNYKGFVSAYLSKKFNQTKFSFLYFNDHFAKYTLPTNRVLTPAVLDPVTGAVITPAVTVAGRNSNGAGSHLRYTYGGMVNHVFGNASGFGKIALQGAFYNQEGRDRDGKKLIEAYHYTLAATYSKGKFSFGPGYDYLSGDKTTQRAGVSSRFDPLYGTPHKFWGLMDFFYAPTGSPAAGLSDFYFKTKFTANEFFVTVDYHAFETARKLATSPSKKLADEVDIIVNYNLNKFTNIEAGYCFANATDALRAAKGLSAGSYDRSASFAYLMINIKPDFLFTKPVAIKN